MPHPSIYSDYRVAKTAAGALAPACGAVLLQTPDGGKRIIHGHAIKDFRTWLAVWSYLYRVRTDQLAAEAAQAKRTAEQIASREAASLQRETMASIPWARVID